MTQVPIAIINFDLLNQAYDFPEGFCEPFFLNVWIAFSRLQTVTKLRFPFLLLDETFKILKILHHARTCLPL